MTISFGKFIPTKVFIDGHEVKNNSSSSVPREIERVTLSMCDCLIKDKNYPNSYLAEQQRRYFASVVDDYKLPSNSPKNKTDITPSSVKTANIEGRRYLITGADIYKYKEEGHELGLKKRDVIDRAEAKTSQYAEGMNEKDYDEAISDKTHVEVQILKQDRVNEIKKHMVKNDRVLGKTLYIHALSNPNYIEGKSNKRDKYRIALIDFKA